MFGYDLNCFPLHHKCSNLILKGTHQTLLVNTCNMDWETEKTSRAKYGRSSNLSVECATATTTTDDLRLPPWDVFAWTATMVKHTRCGQSSEALRIFTEMLHGGVQPSSHTFIAALKACSHLQDLESVRKVHADLLKSGLDSNIYVCSMLVDVYAKCGSLVDARHCFEVMPHRNVVSWTAMILGYAQMEQGDVALQLYRRMQEEGVTPNDRTFVGALKACSSLVSWEQGNKGDFTFSTEECLEQVRTIHSDLRKGKFESDVFVGSILVDVYAKCGSLVDARRVFENLPVRNVVCWTAMILGYAQMDKGEEALQLYARMQQEGITPNNRTYVGALKACSSLSASEEWDSSHVKRLKPQCLKQVRAIHSDVVKSDLELDVYVGTMLVDVYARCGSLVDARTIFEKMPHCNVVCWTAMILGYAQMEEGEEALQLYAKMQQKGIVPDDRTFIGALKACATVAGLQKGKDIHLQILKAGLEGADLFVANSVIDMYCKCGSMCEAQQVFDRLPERDIVTWSSLIAGYAREGESERVFHLFERMRQQGIYPNSITFLSMLTACAHAGLLAKGRKYFEVMSREFGVTPTLEHHTCMIDLLGRAGQIENAIAMINSMPFEPDSTVWETVLTACQKWGNVELGRQAFESALRLDKNNAAAYGLMANIFSTASMRKEAKDIQVMRLKIGAWKQAGQSLWTEVGGIVHAFVVGDQQHSKINVIHAKLKDLSVKMVEERDHGRLLS